MCLTKLFSIRWRRMSALRQAVLFTTGFLVLLLVMGMAAIDAVWTEVQSSVSNGSRVDMARLEAGRLKGAEEGDMAASGFDVSKFNFVAWMTHGQPATDLVPADLFQC